MDLSERILNYRVEHNLTQQELADKVGVTKLTIWRAENNGNISKITKIKIENVIGKEV